MNGFVLFCANTVFRLLFTETWETLLSGQGYFTMNVRLGKAWIFMHFKCFKAITKCSIAFLVGKRQYRNWHSESTLSTLNISMWVLHYYSSNVCFRYQTYLRAFQQKFTEVNKGNGDVGLVVYLMLLLILYSLKQQTQVSAHVWFHTIHMDLHSDSFFIFLLTMIHICMSI